ncbi:MAG: hypothetical protein KDK37_18180 [Leptospiraceae bacterium]|nr:hypothetical protein [Leptospiraceae bacterium]
MAKVYGEVDSLKSLLVELRGNGIQFLNSLEDIEAFRGSYSTRINAARVRAQEALHREKERLKTVIKEQQSEIELSLGKQEELLKTELGSVGKQLADLEQISTSNPFKWLYTRMRRWKLARRLSLLSGSFEEQKRRPFRDLINRTAVLESRLRNREVDPQKHFYSAFLDNELSDLRKANRILKGLRSNYLGAVGEARCSRARKASGFLQNYQRFSRQISK